MRNPLRSREPVEIPDRPQPTKAQKTAAYNLANGLCWWCGKPVARDGLNVQWDHRDPRAITGDDSAENLAPLHVRCHAEKTNGKGGDKTRIAKVKRQERLGEPKVKKRNSLSPRPGTKYDWSRGRYVRGES